MRLLDTKRFWDLKGKLRHFCINAEGKPIDEHSPEFKHCTCDQDQIKFRNKLEDESKNRFKNNAING